MKGHHLKELIVIWGQKDNLWQYTFGVHDTKQKLFFKVGSPKTRKDGRKPFLP